MLNTSIKWITLGLLALTVLVACGEKEAEVESLNSNMPALAIVEVTEEIAELPTPTPTTSANAESPNQTQPQDQQTINQLASGQGGGNNQNQQSNFEAEWAAFLKTCTVRTDWTQTYTVQSGDTLVGIASKLGVDVVELARGNCLKNPSLLTVGQIILFASKSAPLSTPTHTPAPPAAYFTTSATTVRAGESYVVSWEIVDSNYENLVMRRERWFKDQYATAMPPEDFGMMPTSGSMTFTANPTAYREHYNLILYTHGERFEYTLDVDVMPNTLPEPACNSSFFFMETSKQYVYSGGGILNNQVFSLCPSSEASTTNAIMQTFENGFMVYRADTNTIYVLPYTGLAGFVQNFYTDGETLEFPEAPPENLFLPEGIIGKAYLIASEMTQFLGWATAPAVSYTMTYQNSADTIESWQGGVVMTFSSGGRFFLSRAEPGGTPPVWAYLNATN